MKVWLDHSGNHGGARISSSDRKVPDWRITNLGALRRSSSGSRKELECQSVARLLSTQAHGYPSSPGIYTPEQIAAWRVITDQVHKVGGQILMQIQHNGRGSLAIYNPDGSLPVGPSAIRYAGKVYTPGFDPLDPEVPRALETSEIPALIDTFVQAAKNAMAAGFDGVELQAANGHLIDQFLCLRDRKSVV